MPLISHSKDPAGIEKPIAYNVPFGTNVLQWLSENFDSDSDLCGDLACSVVLNGREIFRSDHENKDESILNINLGQTDHLIIINRPGFLGFTAWQIVQIVIAVASIAMAAYAYLSIPDIGSSEGASESPNSKLSAGSNSFRPYQGIPEIFGNAISYPDFVQPSYYYYEDNIKLQVGVFCMTVGEAQVNSVSVGSTNIEAIQNSSATFYGPNVDIPQEYLSIHTQSTEVEGQVLPAYDEDSISRDDQKVSVTGNGATTTISIDDSDYDETTFIYDTGLDIGDYLYIRSGVITNPDPLIPDTELNGVFEILSIPSEASPATFIVDHAMSETYTGDEATVGVGDENGVIGEGLNGELGNYIGWYELAGSETEEVWVNWTMPYGLRSKGGGSASVQIKLSIQTIENDVLTGNIWDKYVSLTKSTADGQYNTEVFNKSNTSGMPTAKFAIRAKRVTKEIDSDGGALEQIQLESVSSVTPYFNQNFGDVTKMLVIRRATLYSADQASKKINVDYTRKLPTYNTTTGVYDESTLVATKSFADAVAYTLIVAGDETTDTVDLDELYGIYEGLSDSDLGEFSYTFDDADLSKGERVSNICAAARVISYHDGVKWRFSRDEVKTIRSALFNRRSTIGNQSKQAWQPQRSDDSDSVRVIYVDAESNTEAYVDRAFNASGVILNDETGVNLKEVNLVGCRNVTQATNRANLEIRRLSYQRRSVTETTYRDSLNIELLDLVGWVDVNDVDMFDGEIMGINGDDYDTTERFIPEDGENYVVFVTDSEGYPSNTVVCSPRLDTEFGFTATGISGAYIASGDQQIGSRYFIANSDDLNASNFTMTSRTPNNDGTVTVELAEYRTEMYEKDSVVAAKLAPQVPAGLSALDFAVSGSDSTSTLVFQTDGVIDLNGTPTSWYSGGVIADIGDFFEVKATLVSGTASGTFNTWLPITANRSWSITETADDSFNTAVVSFTVRQIDYTTSSATNDITLTATVGGLVALPDLITVNETAVSQPLTTINFNSDGTYTGSDGSTGTYTTVSQNIGEFYEIKASSVMQADYPMITTTIMGTLTDVSGDVFEEWHTLNASGASWTLYADTETKTATFYVTVRRIADVLDTDTCIVTLHANIG